MQCYPNQLNDRISKGLSPFYLVFGDEPQQKLDSINLIRQQVQQAGFDERQSLVVDSQFEWQQLLDASMSLSLFSPRQYIELELPTGKPGTEGSKLLAQLAQQDNPDLIILVHGGKIGKEVQNTKWFKSLDGQGVYIPCNPLAGNALKAWLNQQVKASQLQVEADVIPLLMDFCEGNLLAAKQELEKLALLYPDGTISLQQAQTAIVDQSRFNVFQLVDLMLAGDATRTIKVLNRLENEGLEPTILLWALVREWQTLSQLKQSQQQNQPINWNAMRIWKSKQALYLNCLNRLTEEQLTQMGDKLVQMDAGLKSSAIPRPYVELAHIILLFMPMQLAKISLAL